MKKRFISTRQVSVLVIVLVFIFGGSCTPQESNATYFENSTEKTSQEKVNQEIKIDKLDESTQVSKKDKKNSELSENSTNKEKDLIKNQNSSLEINKNTEVKDELIKEESAELVVINEETNNSDDKEDEKIVIEEKTEDKDESEEKLVVENVLDESIIESAKNDVTMADRAEATALAMKRLSAGELRSLIAMSRGGFTVDEKKKALQMMHEKFSQAEQEWILSKFHEYVGGN